MPRTSEHHSSLHGDVCIHVQWNNPLWSGQTPLGPPLSVQNREAYIFLVGMGVCTQAAKDNEADFFRPLYCWTRKAKLMLSDSAKTNVWSLSPVAVVANPTKATDKRLHYWVEFVQLRCWWGGAWKPLCFTEYWGREWFLQTSGWDHAYLSDQGVQIGSSTVAHTLNHITIWL